MSRLQLRDPLACQNVSGHPAEVVEDAEVF